MTRERVHKNGSRPAFTLIELLVVVAIIALLISILLPSLARARELSKRAVCAANMKGMGTGMYTYANENEQMWPICNSTASAASPQPVKYASATMGAYRKSDALITSANISTSRNLWTLVRLQISTQKSFTCPSSDDAPNDDDAPQNFYDFGLKMPLGTEPDAPGAPLAKGAYGTCSYGVQVPYCITVPKAKPSTDQDQRMPLAADKGPFSYFLEAGNGSVVNSPTGVDKNSSPDLWKQWNSPNHGGPTVGEGENVLYADGHVDWAAKPTVGVRNDNIYTCWNGTVCDLGTAVTTAGNQQPQDAADSLIYP